MYILIKDNIEKITDSETMRDKMLSDGYRLFEKEEEKKKKVKK